MSSATTNTTSAPRWRTLSALTIGVLLAHLTLLTGGWPSGMGTDPADSSSGSTDAATPAPSADQGTATGAAAALPAPITSSRVRWIVPKPPAPPPPPVVKVAPRKSKSAPPPPPVEPAPEVVQIPAPWEEVPPALTDEPDPLLAGLEPPVEPADEWMPEPPSAPEATTQGQPDFNPSNDAPAADPPGALPTPPLQPEEPDKPPATKQALPPAKVPPSTRLMYEVTGRVKGINYNASGSLDWQNDGGRYEAHMAVRALLIGSREQTSVGSVVSTGLVPERFGDKSRSERAAHFDDQNQRIRFSNNAPDAAWIAGGQDRLSVFMQLAALLQAQPDAYPAGTIVSLQVAGPGDAEIWRFEMGAEANLNLPAGEMKARHVKRAPRKPFDTQTEMWLAPQLNHLPARIRITQHNGDHVEQSLRYLP